MASSAPTAKLRRSPRGHTYYVEPSPVLKKRSKKDKETIKPTKLETPKHGAPEPLPEPVKTPKLSTEKKITPKVEKEENVFVNRAPVLTLWVAVVSSQKKDKKYNWLSCLTFGRYIAGVFAYSKGKSIGVYKKKTKEEEKEVHERHEKARGEHYFVEAFGRKIPVKDTNEGIRALDASGHPINPNAVQKYLEQKFGKNLKRVQVVMEELAKRKGSKLDHEAYNLYTKFRPTVAAGKQGWGAKGSLSLKLLKEL